MTKNPVMEQMVKLQWRKRTIRVWWTDAGEPHSNVATRVSVWLNLWYTADQEVLPVKQIAQRVAALGNQVAAVEVLNPDGQGVVFYPDWK